MTQPIGRCPSCGDDLTTPVCPDCDEPVTTWEQLYDQQHSGACQDEGDNPIRVRIAE